MHSLLVINVLLVMILGLQLRCCSSCAAAAWRVTQRGPTKHTQGDNIALYATMAGPFRNPTETYEYYSLPFCKPPGGGHVEQPLGEALAGYRPVATPYVLPFRNDVEDAVLCEVTLSSEELKKFRHALAKDYFFQLLYDDLPSWVFVGRVSPQWGNTSGDGATRLELFQHLVFDLSYNEGYVIEITVSADPAKVIDISAPSTVEGDLNVRFSYSAKWRESWVAPERRMVNYIRAAFMPPYMRAHWMAAMTMSGILVVLLLTCTMLLTRITLRNSQTNGPGAAPLDVCTLPHTPPPPHAKLLCAAVGVGSQLLAVAAGLAALGMLGLLGPYSRGRVQLACLLLYAGTGGIAGYVSGLHYRAFGGSHWVANALLCTLLYGAPVLLVFAVTNTVAAAYGSTAALPPGAIVAVLSVWVLLGAPLTALGSLLAARRGQPPPELGCPGTLPRLAQQPAAAISDGRRARWYQTASANIPLQMLLAGCLPCTAACLELYYVLAGIWGFRVYIIPGMHSLIFALLVAVSAASTVIVTVFQMTLLNGRTRWEWCSFLCGGSSGLLMYGYCVFYYYGRTDMSGLLQASFYFGYNALLCYAVFLALGSAGFTASRLFLRALAGRCR